MGQTGQGEGEEVGKGSESSQKSQNGWPVQLVWTEEGVGARGEASGPRASGGESDGRAWGGGRGKGLPQPQSRPGRRRAGDPAQPTLPP